MESFLMLQNPTKRIPSFQISQLNRLNITLPLKGKKMHHFVIQLLSSDMTKSNIKDLDFSQNNGGGNKFKTDKSLFNPERKNWEDLYTEILEQSMNEDNHKTVENVSK